ncbi:hypothetical protein HQ531_07175 [bacterium]|nr:hypothetical protein [bacterium]
MKTTITIITLSVGLLLGCQHDHSKHHKAGAEISHEKRAEMEHKMEGMMKHDMEHDSSSVEKSGNIAYYTCPMESHKHIHSDEPGSCSECGMSLAAATEVNSDEADYFGCPMPTHSHVRVDEAGKCPECGMDLKPYKLTKP